MIKKTIGRWHGYYHYSLKNLNVCLFEKKDPYHSKKSIRVKCYIAELYFHDNKYAEAMDLLLESLDTAKKLRLINQVNECADIIFKNSKIFTSLVDSCVNLKKEGEKGIESFCLLFY